MERFSFLSPGDIRHPPARPALPRPFPEPGTAGLPLPVPCPPWQPLLRLPCPPAGSLRAGGRALQLRPRGMPLQMLAARPLQMFPRRPRGGRAFSSPPGREGARAGPRERGWGKARFPRDPALPAPSPAPLSRKSGRERAGLARDSRSQEPGQARKNRQSRETFRHTNLPLIAAYNRGLFFYYLHTDGRGFLHENEHPWLPFL